MAKKCVRINGNSLIELMLVIAVLAIMVLLAMPNLKRFSIKSKRAEAVQNASVIYVLEQAYMEDNDTYGQLTAYGQSNCPAAVNEINFELTDCQKLRYQNKNRCR